jgi:hypothetical protein
MIKDFMADLQQYKGKLVFNPWQDYDPSCDIGPEAPAIRSANLLRYLTLRQQAKYLFIAEGLGYQGGHFSGMAMTSERILLGFHPTVQRTVVLGENWNYQRTSNPNSALLNKMQKEQGFNEPTATVMWGELAKQKLVPFQTILWNIFPFHPYKESGILTNRTPSKEELDIGIIYAKKLLALVPNMKVIAIGRKSAETLTRYGVECAAVPHPSMGGATRFRQAVAALFATDTQK